jgi:hypothetical protein
MHGLERQRLEDQEIERALGEVDGSHFEGSAWNGGFPSSFYRRG